MLTQIQWDYMESLSKSDGRSHAYILSNNKRVYLIQSTNEPHRLTFYIDQGAVTGPSYSVVSRSVNHHALTREVREIMHEIWELNNKDE